MRQHLTFKRIIPQELRTRQNHNLDEENAAHICTILYKWDDAFVGWDKYGGKEEIVIGFSIFW